MYNALTKWCNRTHTHILLFSLQHFCERDRDSAPWRAPTRRHTSNSIVSFFSPPLFFSNFPAPFILKYFKTGKRKEKEELDSGWWSIEWKRTEASVRVSEVNNPARLFKTGGKRKRKNRRVGRIRFISFQMKKEKGCVFYSLICKRWVHVEGHVRRSQIKRRERERMVPPSFSLEMNEVLYASAVVYRPFCAWIEMWGGRRHKIKGEPDNQKG